MTMVGGSTGSQLMHYRQYPLEFTRGDRTKGFECIDSEITQEKSTHVVEQF